MATAFTHCLFNLLVDYTNAPKDGGIATAVLSEKKNGEEGGEYIGKERNTPSRHKYILIEQCHQILVGSVKSYAQI